ncbi:MAG: response regulator, partial [Flavobacterium sp.]
KPTSKDLIPAVQNNPINTNTVHVNIGKTEQETQSRQQIPSSSSEDIDRLKRLTHILFIDDDVKFKIVKIILNTGWTNTKSIIDLENYDDELLKKSHIVFVDVQGVGKLLDCKDEGLSLALHIKNKYPQKKVVIYSAIQAHKVFHEAIQKVDFLLSKDAEPFEFISLIERFSKEIGL